MRAHLFLQKRKTDFQHQFFKNNFYMPYIEKKIISLMDIPC